MITVPRLHPRILQEKDLQKPISIAYIDRYMERTSKCLSISSTQSRRSLLELQNRTLVHRDIGIRDIILVLIPPSPT